MPRRQHTDSRRGVSRTVVVSGKREQPGGQTRIFDMQEKVQRRHGAATKIQGQARRRHAEQTVQGMRTDRRNMQRLKDIAMADDVPQQDVPQRDSRREPKPHAGVLTDCQTRAVLHAAAAALLKSVPDPKPRPTIAQTGMQALAASLVAQAANIAAIAAMQSSSAAVAEAIRKRAHRQANRRIFPDLPSSPPRRRRASPTFAISTTHSVSDAPPTASVPSPENSPQPAMLRTGNESARQPMSSAKFVAMDRNGDGFVSPAGAVALPPLPTVGQRNIEELHPGQKSPTSSRSKDPNKVDWQCEKCNFTGTLRAVFEHESVCFLASQAVRTRRRTKAKRSLELSPMEQQRTLVAAQAAAAATAASRRQGFYTDARAAPGLDYRGRSGRNNGTRASPRNNAARSPRNGGRSRRWSPRNGGRSSPRNSAARSSPRNNGTRTSPRFGTATRSTNAGSANVQLGKRTAGKGTGSQQQVGFRRRTKPTTRQHVEWSGEL